MRRAPRPNWWSCVRDDFRYAPNRWSCVRGDSSHAPNWYACVGRGFFRAWPMYVQSKLDHRRVRQSFVMRRGRFVDVVIPAFGGMTIFYKPGWHSDCALKDHARKYPADRNSIARTWARRGNIRRIEIRLHVHGPGAEESAPYAGPPIRRVGRIAANARPPIRCVPKIVTNA